MENMDATPRMRFECIRNLSAGQTAKNSTADQRQFAKRVAFHAILAISI